MQARERVKGGVKRRKPLRSLSGLAGSQTRRHAAETRKHHGADTTERACALVLAHPVSERGDFAAARGLQDLLLCDSRLVRCERVVRGKKKMGAIPDDAVQAVGLPDGWMSWGVEREGSRRVDTYYCDPNGYKYNSRVKAQAAAEGAWVAERGEGGHWYVGGQRRDHEAIRAKLSQGECKLTYRFGDGEVVVSLQRANDSNRVLQGHIMISHDANNLVPQRLEGQYGVVGASMAGAGVASTAGAPVGARDTPFHQVPPIRRLVHEIKLRYHHVALPAAAATTTAAAVAAAAPDRASSDGGGGGGGGGGEPQLLREILRCTPLPKGTARFSSIHVVAPPESVGCAAAERAVRALRAGASSPRERRRELHVHRLPECCRAEPPSATAEYRAIFCVASDLVLAKADRASLVIFVGWDEPRFDFYAAAIGMLPFRGLSTALLTRRLSYGDLTAFRSPSSVFEIRGANAARMGMFPIKAVFGPLPGRAVGTAIEEWAAVDISPFVGHDDQAAHPTVELPFKIGALTLPMLTHNGPYRRAVEALGALLCARFRAGFFPIVSCGETCDALGYGRDILAACGQQAGGYYFTHRSGEAHKCWEAYASGELFKQIAAAKRRGTPAVIIAVGGGVNGNCIGLVAAITDSELVEVPTTPMHYNDATTSAKKAFSLVVENKILAKNIMGAFYIPKLVFCVSEAFLTLSSASVHATIGESCKTMNMLGCTDTAVGAEDYHDIAGGAEFASDYTKIVRHVEGFDALVRFIEDAETKRRKAAIVALGRRIHELAQQRRRRGDAGANAPGDEEAQLLRRRAALLEAFRARYHALGSVETARISEFLSVVNKEIVAAKAMFLAYSDPFEKFRALLFEYAHTLGHGVEAFANLAYTMAAERGIAVPEEALRLHGQCVGMAVLWAGQMSLDLGELRGRGFALHQGFVYIFNRHGGFDFRPLRLLLDELGVSKAQFCEGVLEVVRRDNKRGYCACSGCGKSVDQLVTGRPGKMMRSTDENAALRYLVEVDEEWQSRVLGMAFDGYFDKAADVDEDGNLVFLERRAIVRGGGEVFVSSSAEVGEHIHKAMRAIYTTAAGRCPVAT